MPPTIATSSIADKNRDGVYADVLDNQKRKTKHTKYEGKIFIFGVKI